MNKEKKENGAMIKVATFIVDKRNLFFLLFVLAIIFSIIAMNWVKVENQLSAYLPAGNYGDASGSGSDGSGICYLRFRQGHGVQYYI